MSPHSLERLHDAVLAHKLCAPSGSRTAELFRAGRKKIAQKLGEEAVEIAVEAMADDRRGVVAESADLLYHLAVLWAELGVEPAEVWRELDRREQLYGIAEKLRKSDGLKRAS